MLTELNNAASSIGRYTLYGTLLGGYLGSRLLSRFSELHCSRVAMSAFHNDRWINGHSESNKIVREEALQECLQNIPFFVLSCTCGVGAIAGIVIGVAVETTKIASRRFSNPI